jgi:hypothetical protein
LVLVRPFGGEVSPSNGEFTAGLVGVSLVAVAFQALAVLRFPFQAGVFGPCGDWGLRDRRLWDVPRGSQSTFGAWRRATAEPRLTGLALDDPQP